MPSSLLPPSLPRSPSPPPQTTDAKGRKAEDGKTDDDDVVDGEVWLVSLVGTAYKLTRKCMHLLTEVTTDEPSCPQEEEEDAERRLS